MRSRWMLPLALIALAGCRNDAPASSTAAPNTPQPTDKWLGRWDGPEGTYLMLSKTGDHYTVEIRDLDGPRFFEGTPDGDRIRFVRDNKTEFLTSGNGETAGMKWLLNKKHCLLTHKGEGWCRD